MTNKQTWNREAFTGNMRWHILRSFEGTEIKRVLQQEIHRYTLSEHGYVINTEVVWRTIPEVVFDPKKGNTYA